jgi:uncharacterized protein (DUF362 family)/Pyruvate/2-oxoacid:ferredoxin oxidoreductase delta subunit
MDPQLPAIIGNGDRVLVKPFLRHGSAGPESRLVSHPEVVRMVVEAVKDCGAIVTLGDAGLEKRRDDSYWPNGRLLQEIAKSFGATLVSFGEAGARYVKSGVLYPRKYLVSRAVLDVDEVIGCANFQPHRTLVLSGAVKNMFNALVGKCQGQLHSLFPHPDDIARVIVDVCAVVKPTTSFLDLTTVRDPIGTANLIPTGLILASSDPVALDTVAATAAGFGYGDAPTIRLGNKMKLGCSDRNRITVEGLDWQAMQFGRVKESPSLTRVPEGAYNRASRFINKVVLRPILVINQTVCSSCGDCYRICPINSINRGIGGKFFIDQRACTRCDLCVDACDANAVDIKDVIFKKLIRRLMNKSPSVS